MTAQAADNDVLVERLLASARSRLGMDVAFVSRISGDEHEIAMASGPLETFGTSAGSCASATDMYCGLVFETRKPLVIADVKDDLRTSAMAVTEAGHVGSYVGVPLEGASGELYGTLCCLSHSPEDALGDRDVQYMMVIADVLAEHLDAVERLRQGRREAVARINGVLGGGDDALRTVFQPIVALADGALVGVEALSRFPGPPLRPPDEWFSDAAAAGLGPVLELEAATRAIRRARDLTSPAYLSVNASPGMLTSCDLEPVVRGLGPGRLVVEVTEHDAVEAYDELLDAIAGLRSLGVRLAVDDAGSGYASFRHILSLRPDVIKLDVALVRGIDEDAGRRSLAKAIVSFATEFGASLVAEGVEVAEEMETLRSLGVRYAQGYLFGRPSSSLPKTA